MKEGVGNAKMAFRAPVILLYKLLSASQQPKIENKSETSRGHRTFKKYQCVNNLYANKILRGHFWEGVSSK